MYIGDSAIADDVDVCVMIGVVGVGTDAGS